MPTGDPLRPPKLAQPTKSAAAKAKSAVDRIEGAIPYFEALGEITNEARGQGATDITETCQSGSSF